MTRFLSAIVLLLTAPAAVAQITLNSGVAPNVVLSAPEFAGELMRPETSSDLLTWQTLPPLTVDPDGKFRFTDYGGLGQTHRFYRAVTVATSPPGTWMVYERRTEAGVSTVYRSHLDGSSETSLVLGRYPRPSPNGRWILFTRDGTGPSGHAGADIYVFDTTVIAGPANPRLVYDNASVQRYDIVNYSFKHDNFTFVFDYGSGVDGRIYTLNINGGNPQVFPAGDCQEAMPSYNPSDSTMVFAHRIPAQLATRSGGVKHILTTPGRGDSWPQWSPDGTWIAACDGNTDYTRTDLGHDLQRIDPATGFRTPLTQVTEAGDGFPFGGVWSANNLWVYAAGTVDGVQGVWRVPASGGAPQTVPIPSASLAPVVFMGGIHP